MISGVGVSVSATHAMQQSCYAEGVHVAEQELCPHACCQAGESCVYAELRQNRSCSTHRLRSGQLSTAGIRHDAQLLQSGSSTDLLRCPARAMGPQVAANLSDVVRLLGCWCCRQLRQLAQGSAAGFEC
jgi:hypothetical protein